MKDIFKIILAFAVTIAIEIAIGCLIASLLCDINPSKTYSWLGGIWHGCFFLPNLIRSIFTDAIFKAQHYTTSYNVFWWMFTVLSCLGVLFSGNRRN